MFKLSVISHFYNHLEGVQAQIDSWNQLPDHLIPHVEFILIDDCSEQQIQLKPSRINLRLYRISTDIHWNQAGARNLGIFHARAPWMLLFDIDQRLTPETLPTILLNLHALEPNVMYSLITKGLYNGIDRVKADRHISTFLVNRDRFKEIGVYDEDFVGHYGYEDIFMHLMWMINGGREAFLNQPYFFEVELNFKTERLDRNLERNKLLMAEKYNNAIKKLESVKLSPQNILRFQWHQVKLG
jgi:glycosyltransferase involved in cell wall biosynthesis